MILRLSYEPYQWIVSIYKLFLNIFSIVSNEQNLIFVLVLYVLYSRCLKLRKNLLHFLLTLTFETIETSDNLFVFVFQTIWWFQFFFSNLIFCLFFRLVSRWRPQGEEKVLQLLLTQDETSKKKNIFQFSTEKIIFSFVLSNWLKSFFVCDLTAKNRLLIYSFLFCF